MIRSWIALALVGALPLCVAGEQAASRFEIIPGKRWGQIVETTTRAELIRLFGNRAVIDRQVGIGEGFCTPGTIVLHDSPNEIEIAWQDKARTRVAFVVTAKRGDWKTRRGVRVGTSLTELESLAGKVLTFNGFGWDYGGGMQWTEGEGSLALELDPDPDSMTEAIRGTREIFGDREVRSDHPAIRAMKITVHWMRQAWGRHFEEADCA